MRAVRSRDERRWPRILASDSAGRPSLLIETVLVALLLTVYDKLKDLGAARRSAAIDHGFALLHLEGRLHMAIEASTNRWMNAHVWLGDLSSYFYEFAWCFVAIAALVVCWWRRPDVYRPARNAMLLINAVGLAVFLVDPTAPPRLLPGSAFRDTVAAAGFGTAHDGRLPADQYAAMPSLHMGWSIFAAVLICRMTSNRLARAVAVAYPILTAGVVVSSANHYVLDVVAGSVLAVVACLVTRLLRMPTSVRLPALLRPASRGATVPAPVIPLQRTRTVLIISASIGAGHDGAAAELRRRLERQGYEVQVRDFLDALIGPVGFLFKNIYGGMLRAVPQSYNWLYWGIEHRPWMERVSRWFAGWSSFTLRRWLRDGADIVVSTYPLASQALGRLRSRGELRVPLLTFLTDMSVSKMWVHPGVDLHLAVSDATADQARAAGAGATVVTGPMVPDRFNCTADPEVRRRTRADLGLSDDDYVALLVAGSWGVGDVEATARELIASGVAVPVVICGRNADLRNRLSEVPGLVAIGWTDAMQELMSAADVLVQNAGGLSCMEAFASGLPAVSYRCIPGHGEHNAGVMDRIGVAPWVHTQRELTSILRTLRDPDIRSQQVELAAASFRHDPADVVIAQALGSDGVAFSPHRQRRRRRVAAGLASVAVLSWAGTGGVAAAASHGVGIVHPAAGERSTVYLVVRVDAKQHLTPASLRELSDLHAAVVVDRTMCRVQPKALPRLTAEGIPLVLQGSKSLRMVHAPAEPAANGLTGIRPFVLVSDRRPDAMDVGLAYLREDNLVAPQAVIRPTSATIQVPTGVVLVDLRGTSGNELATELNNLDSAVEYHGLIARGLVDLRGIRT
jgi:UDP-N-acetylglucosamine:LPS N-acetylglucosamine transferase